MQQLISVNTMLENILMVSPYAFYFSTMLKLKSIVKDGAILNH